MVNCFAPQCTHQTHNCRLFSFPKSPQKFRKWTQLIRRKDKLPNSLSRLCECHFSNKWHYKDKTVLPTLFTWNVSRKLDFKSAEKRQRRRSTLRSIADLHELTGNTELSPGTSGGVSAQNVKKTVIFEPAEKSEGQKFAPTYIADCQEGVLNPETELATSTSGTAEVPVLRDADKEGLVTSHTRASVTNSEEPVHATAISPEGENVLQCKCFDCKLVFRRLKETNRKLEDQMLVLKKQLEFQQKEHEDIMKQYQHALAKGDIAVQAENFLLMSQLEEMEKKLKEKQRVFMFTQIADDDNLVFHYTGLPCASTFNALVSVFDNMTVNYYSGWRVSVLSTADQIFMTLIKLRRNLSHKDLAVRFHASTATVKNIVMTWLHALHFVLIGAENSLMSKMPSRQKIQKHLPQCFEKYLNTRIILDCTEIRTADPELLSKHNKMFSSYKHHVKAKGLVSISPNGAVTFASQLYPGRTSDKDIVKHSGVLKYLNPGDAIMADKGFLISSMLPDGVVLNLPPFKETPKFTRVQVDRTYDIAQARIHVERAIQRIKCYRILDYIPQFYLPISSLLFQTCAALTNLKNPLLCNNEENEN